MFHIISSFQIEGFLVGHGPSVQRVHYAAIISRVSDVGELAGIRFSEAYSLAYALVEGAAEVLEVPSSDLNATVAFSERPDRLPPIILYDNVPGGAGLVARLEQEDDLLRCFDSALKRVSGNCG